MSRRESRGSSRGALVGAVGRFRRMASRFRNDATGATAIEYGLVAGLIFLAIVSALRLYADRVAAMYNSISSAIAGPP